MSADMYFLRTPESDDYDRCFRALVREIIRAVTTIGGSAAKGLALVHSSQPHLSMLFALTKSTCSKAYRLTESASSGFICYQPDNLIVH
ncbi:hypothetical protein IAQ61_001298 [Plenodomus lingam]|uniref:uncharacterized protein n=1 Tax=Leptosphaeria maculans TaxID=5022 RepID=UPI003319E0AA|nr:hypothetical protein IAQ61_001298 [Plenodomus lingam]